MASVTADDVIKRLSDAATRRADFDDVWRQVADVAAPDAPDFRLGSLNAPDILGVYRASAARRSKNMYDGTAAWAVDRLASGLEGLMMPQSETWHTLTPNDLFSVRYDPTDEDVEWLEGLRDFQFRVRYDAQSGWQTAIQVALRRCVAFGNGLMMVEDGEGPHLIRYRHLPLRECYLGEDHYGNVDTFIRVYSLTARQAVQKFGERTPPEIKNMAEKSETMDKSYQFIHMICPRGDVGGLADGIRKAPWASIHVAYAQRVVVAESGYYEFPVIDFRWLPEPGRVYGEGPVMRVLADIQSLNLMAKNEMIASQQAIDPPLLVKRNGVINKPNTNPGKLIAGGIDEQGREVVKPLLLGQRIDFSQAVIQAKRENLRESLYINLFATMVQNPRMSATEALIKANEKGELLGPAGTRIQQSLARLVERELGILSRFGVFEKGSVYAPPRSLQGRSIGPKFTSQLDRIRKSKDVEGAIRLLEVTTPVAQTDPSIYDNIDKDEFTRGAAEVLGVPRKWLKRREEVAAIREQQAQKVAMAEQLAMAQQAADAAHKAAPALETLTNVGGLAA
jgi:hypothetical protein